MISLKIFMADYCLVIKDTIQIIGEYGKYLNWLHPNQHPKEKVSDP